MSLPPGLQLISYVGGPYDGQCEWERAEFCVDGHERLAVVGELVYVYIARGGRYLFAKAYRPAREHDDCTAPAMSFATRAAFHSVIECDPRGMRE